MSAIDMFAYRNCMDSFSIGVMSVDNVCQTSEEGRSAFFSASFF